MCFDDLDNQVLVVILTREKEAAITRRLWKRCCGGSATPRPSERNYRYGARYMSMMSRRMTHFSQARLRRGTASAQSLSCGNGLAVVFGGFGFTPRQLARHEGLYAEHGFNVLPVLSTVPQLVTPNIALKRAQDLASRMQSTNAPTVIHCVSGSFWTAMFALSHLDPDWREANIRAIMFDSCPPKSDIYAFGGWLSWLIQAKTGLSAALVKPVTSQLFRPVRPYFGIDEKWSVSPRPSQEEDGCPFLPPFATGAEPVSVGSHTLRRTCMPATDRRKLRVASHRTVQNDVFMFGDEAHGRRARALPEASGETSAECVALSETAVRQALAELDAQGDDNVDDVSARCVVPRSAHCLFVRGRNDPVLEPQYVDSFYAFLKARTTASVELHLFEKAQHAMAVVEHPEMYKAQHVERLLRKVPEWGLNVGGQPRAAALAGKVGAHS